MVAALEAGVLMSSRTAEGCAEGVAALRRNYPDHASTRRYAEGFSWNDTTNGQIELFRHVLAGSRT